MAKRIQLRRKKGWRKPEGAVVVSRPSGWGNPFSVDACTTIPGWWIGCVAGDFNDVSDVIVMPHTVEECVALYRLMMLRRVNDIDEPLDLSELRGKDLCCWCELGKPCHADVLLELANA